MSAQGMNESIYNNTNKNKGKEHKSDGRGRPTKHTGPTKTISVVFDRKRFVDINVICVEVLKNTENKLAMTELIRGITEAVLDSDLDLKEAENEQQVYELVTRAVQ